MLEKCARVLVMAKSVPYRAQKSLYFLKHCTKQRVFLLHLLSGGFKSGREPLTDCFVLYFSVDRFSCRLGVYGGGWGGVGRGGVPCAPQRPAAVIVAT